jgi:hypothetical protein
MVFDLKWMLKEASYTFHMHGSDKCQRALEEIQTKERIKALEEKIQAV